MSTQICQSISPSKLLSKNLFTMSVPSFDQQPSAVKEVDEVSDSKELESIFSQDKPIAAALSRNKSVGQYLRTRLTNQKSQRSFKEG